MAKTKNTKIRNYISENHDFLLRIMIYSYMALIIILAYPIFNIVFHYPIHWYMWEESTNFWGDIHAYERMAYYQHSIVGAPYKFRVLVPFLWSLFLPIMSLNSSVLLWNFIFLLSSNLVLDNLLKRLNFSNNYKILGIILLDLSIPIFMVSYTPNLDVPMIFFAMLFMLGVIKKDNKLIAISSILGVITKESFLLIFPVLIIYNLKEIKEITLNKNVEKRKKKI